MQNFFVFSDILYQQIIEKLNLQEEKKTMTYTDSF